MSPSAHPVHPHDVWKSHLFRHNWAGPSTGDELGTASPTDDRDRASHGPIVMARSSFGVSLLKTPNATPLSGDYRAIDNIVSSLSEEFTTASGKPTFCVVGDVYDADMLLTGTAVQPAWELKQRRSHDARSTPPRTPGSGTPVR
jgi:hypothetical protein